MVLSIRREGMGLRLKFNLVLIVLFLAGFAAAGLVSRQLLQENAREEVIRDARLMMEAAISVRTYTIEQVRPHLIKMMDEVFFPQTVPAYAATEATNHLRKKYREYSYKEATLNPTNPRNRTLDGRPTWSTGSATIPTCGKSCPSASRPPAAAYSSPTPSRSATRPACSATASRRPRRPACSRSTAKPM